MGPLVSGRGRGRLAAGERRGSALQSVAKKERAQIVWRRLPFSTSLIVPVRVYTTGSEFLLNLKQRTGERVRVRSFRFCPCLMSQVCESRGPRYFNSF
ncbi:hypothetical protein PAHAL_1G430000 [Panicum hallii]|uniref:Uncharacterized protein n=1 Tax=Panicum hallii TaxID=206008 RepID=A0A2T8KY42_9POAL|nr:hypothetical protein PAHAL_1G430000 [Panicum hallii]